MARRSEQTVRVIRPDETDADATAPPERQGETPVAERAGSAASDAATEARVKPDPSAPRQPPAQAPDQPAAKAAPGKPKGGKRKFIFMGIGLVALLAGAAYGVNYYLVGRFHISTDDAYVRANNTTIGARVSGNIAGFEAADNTRVSAGQVLARIEDGDYRLAVQSASGRVATQEATIARIGRQADALRSNVTQAQSQVDAAKAAAQRTQLDFDRQQQLSARGFASQATFEASRAARDQAVAQQQGAEAALVAAQANVDVAQAQQIEAQRQLDELKTSLAKAERDLGFTVIRAPVDGVFGNRISNAGDYVQPGQRLGHVVPLDAVYIDANFKETQVARLQPGQPVDIDVDAFGSKLKVQGAVDSLSPASGSVFTLLPPDNATGNFTKIVQRLPVRIRVPKDVARQNLLRAGMSVYTTVDTRAGAADADSDADLDAPQTIHPQ